MRKLGGACAAFGLLGLVMQTAAHAADPETSVAAPADDGFRIGIGAGVAPDYLGSDDYGFIPLPNFEWKHSGFAVRSSRLGAELDLLPMQGIDAGPILRYDLGRKDVSDDIVDLLPEVDGTLEAGGYLGLAYPLLGADSGAPTILTARVEFLTGVSGGHDGSTIGGSLGVIQPLGEDLTLIANASATYMSGGYAEEFFSVSAAGAAASGLPVYDAGAGMRDFGAGLILNYQLTEQLSVFAVGRYTRLVGDAKDSPIVADRGDADQFLGGLGVSFKFY